MLRNVFTAPFKFSFSSVGIVFFGAVVVTSTETIWGDWGEAVLEF